MIQKFLFLVFRSAVSLSLSRITILTFVRSLARHFSSTFHRWRYFTCPQKCHDCENRGRNLQKFITPCTVLWHSAIQRAILVFTNVHTRLATHAYTLYSITLRIHSHCIVLFRVIYKILPSIRHSLKFLYLEDEARATCTYSLGIYLHTC